MAATEPREDAVLRFLERADLALGALEDPRDIFARLAALLVPELGDLCAVWIADGGPPRALAVRHADARLETLAAKLLERYPLAPSDPLGRVLYGTEPLLCERVDPAGLTALAQDPAHRALLDELGPRSAVLVPIRFGDGARGLVALATGGERSLGPSERSVLNVLARRVGAAYEVDRLRAEDRRTARNFQVLSEAGRLFSESLDLQATLDAFVRLSVPELADAVALNIVDGDGVTRTAALDARDPEHRSLLSALRDAYVVERTPRRAAKLFVHDDAHEHERGKVSWIAPDRLPVLHELGYRSSLVVPLVSHGVVRGDLVCHFAHKSRAFDAATLALFEELARRAAVAIENAQMYRREKRIADEVQKALLPSALPQVPGYVFDAVYSPSERDVEVGGDWFDAFPLPDGRVVISIGDVFEHGLHAAVVMSSIRHGLRVLALQQSQPDRMLQVVDDALARDYPDVSASAVVALLDPSAQTLTYSVAGHPSPLLRTPDGEVHALRGSGVPLGVRGAVTPNVQTVALPLGATLVFYTDGLVEATRGDTLNAEQRLRGALRDGTLVRDAHPAELIKRLVLERGGADDVAVLTIRVRSSIPQRSGFVLAPQWVFRADDARSAEDARAGFIAFLKTRGVPDADYTAAELVFGELIGNVVRHAPGPITIELDWDKDDPVLHVIDRGAAFEPRAVLPVDLLSESGRGLFLISVLADDFAVTSLPDYGNHTRVKLKIERLENLPDPAARA